MVGSDRIVEARLEEAPVGVADVLAVIRDVDDPVPADLAWTRSPAPDVAVVRLALELPARSIGRLVVVLELRQLRPQLLLLLLQRPLGAAGAPDGARRQRVVVLARDEAARLALDGPELDPPPRAVGLVAIVVHHVVVIAAVLVLVVSVDDATV